MLTIFTVWADGIIALSALACAIWSLVDGAFIKHATRRNGRTIEKQEEDIARLVQENRDQNQENRDRHQEVRGMFISHNVNYEDRHEKLKERMSDIELFLKSMNIQLGNSDIQKPLPKDIHENKIVHILAHKRVK